MDWSGDSAAEISTHGPFIFFISLRRQKGAHELSQAAAGEREGCSAWVEGDTGQSSTKQYVLVKVRPEKSCSHLTVFLHVTVALRASNHCIRTNIYVGRRRGTRRRKATQRSIMLFLSPSPALPLISLPFFLILSDSLSLSPFGANSVMLSFLRPSPSSFIRILLNEWCCTTSCGYSVCQLAPSIFCLVGFCRLI